jgi:hypothetical protein
MRLKDTPVERSRRRRRHRHDAACVDALDLQLDPGIVHPSVHNLPWEFVDVSADIVDVYSICDLVLDNEDVAELVVDVGHAQKLAV